MTVQPHASPATAPRRPEKTPAGIRAALPPDIRPEFEADYRAALTEAADTFDLTPVHQCMDIWHGHAMLAVGSPDGYRQMLAMAELDKAGVPPEEILARLGITAS